MYMVCYGGMYMKCLVLTRRKMLTICACFVVCGLAVVFSVKGIQAVQTAYVQKVPIYSVPTPDKQVALTFDCAWDIDHTEEYIDILQKYQVEATFFVTGVWAEKYTNAVKQISEAGYEIGNLGNTYERIPQLSQADMMSNLMQCNETLKKITGKTPVLFRPPYGDYNALLLDTANTLEMQAVQWDIDSFDQHNTTVQGIADKVMEEAKSGSIILLHNRSDLTLEALPYMIETLQSEGYEIVSVSQLMRNASERQSE